MCDVCKCVFVCLFKYVFNACVCVCFIIPYFVGNSDGNEQYEY